MSLQNNNQETQKPDQIVDVLKNHLKKPYCSVCSGAKKPVPYKKPPY